MSTKAKLALAVALLLSTSSVVLAAPKHAPASHRYAPTSKIDSGYGPPRNWNEIEQGNLN